MIERVSIERVSVPSRSAPMIMLFGALTVITIIVVASLGKTSVLVALPLAGITLGLYLVREKTIIFSFGDEALHFESPNWDLPYHMIDLVSREIGGSDDEFTIVIHYGKEMIRIPPLAGLSSNLLLDELQARVPQPNRDLLPGPIRQFYVEECEKFGSDRVFAIFHQPAPRRILARTFTGFVLGGIFGTIMMIIIASPVLNQQQNQPFVVILGLTFMLFWIWFIYILIQMQRINRYRESCGLVISPTGIALLQGKIKGKLKWAEVKAIHHPPKKEMIHRTTNSRNGIGVHVAGAMIIIEDHYHVGCKKITKIMNAYWRELPASDQSPT